MQPQTRSTIDGLLAIGPHGLDAQFHALASYAVRTRHTLDVVWAILPGESPATDAPNSDFPIVVFDDEIAQFTDEEYADSSADEAADSQPTTATDWHVAHPIPQAKQPTTHLPVYGCPGEGETAADALLCIGLEPLDLQIARIEAYAMRSAVRLRGVYVATGAENLRVLLLDFRASNRALGTGPTLTVGPNGEIEVHV
jgi:hypothetical protein